MRYVILGLIVLAMAAAPCAWDGDPREPASVLSLLAPAPSSAAAVLHDHAAYPDASPAKGQAATAPGTQSDQPG